MYSKLKTCILNGLEGQIIDVEIDMAKGLPTFNIVGLASTSIKEAKERVWSAIKNSGYEFPLKRIIVNLAPANIRKEGSQIDLSIAMGILNSNGVIIKDISDIVFMGELLLDGKVNRVSGALPMIISIREKGYKKCIVPIENYRECNIFDDMEIVPIKNLRQLVDYLNGSIEIKIEDEIKENKEEEENLDFCDIKGQESLKRALEIVAAGGHNILIIGPPGSGKTMAAKRLPSIMPKLNFDEAVEVTKIYSISNVFKVDGLVSKRPFRSPHHTTSTAALVGGGRTPKPGEVSYAHNGILFLDELPEFNRNALEVLRQPLEDGEVHISRINGHTKFPAKFILVASMNPCKCGHYGNPKIECSCTDGEINRYLNKISSPLLDRIDLHMEVKPINFDDLQETTRLEKSEEIRKRVEKAKKIQMDRFKATKIYSNSQINGNQLKKYCELEDDVKDIMKIAFNKYNFSARTHDRILRVSRTIADLDNKENIESNHILEAISYRTINEKYFR